LTGRSLVCRSLLLASDQILINFLIFHSFTPCISFGALDTCILCERRLLSDRDMATLPCMGLLFLKQTLVIHSFHRIFVLDLLNLIHESCISIFNQLVKLSTSCILKQRFISYSLNIQSVVHHHHLCCASCQQNTWT
jgi:hypothetical protein